jgi:hypothetical protein
MRHNAPATSVFLAGCPSAEPASASNWSGKDTPLMPPNINPAKNYHVIFPHSLISKMAKKKVPKKKEEKEMGYRPCSFMLGFIRHKYPSIV